LSVVEVEVELAANQTDADCRYPPDEQVRHAELFQPPGQRHVGARDGCRSRAAICLDHVTVKRDGAFPKPQEVDDGPESAPDQPLDLVRPAPDPASARLALTAFGPRSRQHAVLGCHPASSLATQEWRNPVLDGRRADNPRIADTDQHRPLGELEVVGNDLHRAKLVREAPVSAPRDGDGRHPMDCTLLPGLSCYRQDPCASLWSPPGTRPPTGPPRADSSRIGSRIRAWRRPSWPPRATTRPPGGAISPLPGAPSPPVDHSRGSRATSCSPPA